MVTTLPPSAEKPITVFPPTTNSSKDDNDQSETESDSQVVSTTGVVSSVPSGSETATDGLISTSDANVGLIVGLAIAILVIMSLVIAMVTIAAVALRNVRKLKICLLLELSQT